MEIYQVLLTHGTCRFYSGLIQDPRGSNQNILIAETWLRNVPIKWIQRVYFIAETKAEEGKEEGSCCSFGGQEGWTQKGGKSSLWEETKELWHW